MAWRLGRVAGVATGAAVLAVLVTLGGGCGGDSRPVVSADALTASRQADLTPAERVEAVQRVKASVASGELDRTVARHAMKEMAWALDTPEPVRAAALEAILWDEQAEADSVQLVREMLPTEPGRACVAVMSTAVADHGWTEATPALVRSLARPVVGVPDEERAELRALRALHPDTPPAEVAMGVFLDPQTEPGPAGLQLDMRTREAAWELVGRLSEGPGARDRLLDSAQGGDEQGRVLLEKMRRVRDAFGVTPERAQEMRWAARLADEREGRLSGWWAQTAEATARAGRREGLGLRHLEAVRWASQERPAWLSMDREGLLGELESRLSGRQTYARTQNIRGMRNDRAERLATVRDRLSWGDVLTVLVLDEALATEGVRATLFEAAEADNRDRTTEHGGTIWADAAGFHVQRFTPRGTATPDDRRFEAPREMIDYSSAALVHFHFHVSNWRNRDYAGPSPGDLDYAAMQGRVCMTLTGVERDLLNADVFFPDGAVLDLGQVRPPAGGR